ncbi:ARID domain-containing protein [Plasmodiophora brassicae]|uniref:ARID domain-containing protein n=1 Tax=Plasmodiophora brassicae TaxID=37360 RepID=A0A0G4IZE7_PLABS|nr:hypothetical protein PBRA_001568 [Plasmodiophora brassicae]SPQ93987.1 unnamed protein product [Plasmodiophora brassicae]
MDPPSSRTVVDGIAVDEYAVAPSPLRQSASGSSSSLLPQLRPADLPMTKGRPPLIQCDTCLKWRVVDGPVEGLPSTWSCGDCAVGEDDWAIKASAIVGFDRLDPIPSKPLVVHINRASGTVVGSSARGGRPAGATESGWQVPEAFLGTAERQAWYEQLERAFNDKGKLPRSFPRCGNADVDLYGLNEEVEKLGGVQKVTADKLWGSVAKALGMDVPPYKLRSLFERVLGVLHEDAIEAQRQQANGERLARKRPRTEAPVTLERLQDLVMDINDRLSAVEAFMARVDVLNDLRARIESLSRTIHDQTAVMNELVPELEDAPLASLQFS